MVFVFFVFFIGHQNTVIRPSLAHAALAHAGGSGVTYNLSLLVLFGPLVWGEITFEFFLQQSGVFSLSQPHESQNYHRP